MSFLISGGSTVSFLLVIVYNTCSAHVQYCTVQNACTGLYNTVRMYGIVQYSTHVQYCTILNACTVLYNTVRMYVHYCTILYACTVLYNTVRMYNIVQCSTYMYSIALLIFYCHSSLRYAYFSYKCLGVATYRIMYGTSRKLIRYLHNRMRDFLYIAHSITKFDMLYCLVTIVHMFHCTE